MKRFYHILLASALLAVVSCQGETPVGGGSENGGSESKEVEIEISTSRSTTTRAPLDGEATDVGGANEDDVNTLDLLIFKWSEDGVDANATFLYRKRAAKVSSQGSNVFRVLLEESEEMLSVHLFANVSHIIDAWENNVEEEERIGSTWATVHSQIQETNPARLVNRDIVQYLPMYGNIIKTTISSTTSPNRWGPVNLQRSVASADVYVQENGKTANFDLESLFAYYTADKAYIGAVADAENLPYYLIPSDMETGINAIEGTTQATSQLQAVNVNVRAEEIDDEGVFFEGIAYQMYFYENPYITTAGQVAGHPKRPTRLIIGGKYKTSSAPDTWVDAYYPVDFVDATGKYAPIRRNWKYEFRVTAVTGPGYPSLEEAAEGAVTDLNINIVSWNKDEVEIGVTSKYYVTMEEKEVYLWRNAGDNRTLRLSYKVLEGTNDDFIMDFDDTSDQEKTSDGNTIQNPYFEVEMLQTKETTGGTVDFTITALQYNETETDREESVIVKFRNLEFTIYITQLYSSEEDWEDGGEIPSDL